MGKWLWGVAMAVAVMGAASPSFADRDYHDRGWGAHHRDRFHHHGRPVRPPAHWHKGDRVVVYGDDWRVRISGRSRDFFPAPPVYTVRETRIVQPVVMSQPVVTAPVSWAPLAAVPVSADFVDSVGRTCREYQSTIRVDGRVQPAYGTACLGADGAWVVSD